MLDLNNSGFEVPILGDPDKIEVSGNPQFKNERWKYNNYISTKEGYKLEKTSLLKRRQSRRLGSRMTA